MSSAPVQIQNIHALCLKNGANFSALQLGDARTTLTIVSERNQDVFRYVHVAISSSPLMLLLEQHMIPFQ